MSEKFEVSKELRRGDTLSPTLFNLAMEQAMRAIRTNPAGTINNRMT
jgi:hypothetical protein